MPTFHYNAVNRQGESCAGQVDAGNQRQAIAALAARGEFVTNVMEAEAAAKASAGLAWGAMIRVGRGRVSLHSRAIMLRHLATAMEAGLPLASALTVVHEQAENEAAASLLGDLAGRVQSGESLSDAMAAHREVFAPLHVSMVRAGETAGVLDEVMRSLAEFAERDLDIRQKIRSAATYPLVVMALALASVVVILVFIIPNITEAIDTPRALLPLPTRLLMGMADGLVSWWGLLGAIVLVVGAWGFRHWIGTPAGRLTFDQFKLRIPVLGPTLRKVAVGRFARTLGTLTGSGIQILEALNVLRDTLGNEALAREIDEVRAAVTEGESLAEPLRARGQFPPLFIQVIALGEKTGKLDELLLRAADAYEKETSDAIERTMTILPAVLILGLAVVVAFILIAVLLPIVNMQVGLPGT